MGQPGWGDTPGPQHTAPCIIRAQGYPWTPTHKPLGPVPHIGQPVLRHTQAPVHTLWVTRAGEHPRTPAHHPRVSWAGEHPCAPAHRPLGHPGSGIPPGPSTRPPGTPLGPSTPPRESARLGDNPRPQHTTPWVNWAGKHPWAPAHLPLGHPGSGTPLGRSTPPRESAGLGDTPGPQHTTPCVTQAQGYPWAPAHCPVGQPGWGAALGHHIAALQPMVSPRPTHQHGSFVAPKV